MTRTISFMEKEEMTPDQYRNGHNLTSEHKGLISSEREIWQVSLVENIHNTPPNSLFLELIGETLNPLDTTHYETTLDQWAKQEYFFMSQRLGERANLGTFLEEADTKHLRAKCRICYALKHPEKVRLNGKPENHYLTALLLQRAEQISDQQYVAKIFTEESNPLAA